MGMDRGRLFFSLVSKALDNGAVKSAQAYVVIKNKSKKGNSQAPNTSTHSKKGGGVKGPYGINKTRKHEAKKISVRPNQKAVKTLRT